MWRSDAVCTTRLPAASRSERSVVRSCLPHIRVDDWVFGVSSVSKDGFESPVASAVPGGAFKPGSRDRRTLSKAGTRPKR